MKEISIIIPNYNGAYLLEECLESILNQTFKDYEIIVVDDASSDHSVEFLKHYPVKVIVNEENLGFAGTVNRGINNATGNYVLLLNNDVVLEKDFLENLYTPFLSSSNIFSLSPKMIRYKERDLLDDTGDEYTLLGWTYKRGDGDPVNTYNTVTPVFSTCAGAGLYKREILEKIGLLDPLHFAYLEDVDLGWRALIAGYENFYIPNAKCYHIGSATLADGNKYSEQKVYLSARNNIYIIYKNMPLGQLIINFPFLTLGFLVKILYFYKQGFHKSYVKGLLEGLKTVKTLKKVAYLPSNLPNYLRIESKMAVSTITYVGTKLKAFAKKGFTKLKEFISNKKAALN